MIPGVVAGGRPLLSVLTQSLRLAVANTTLPHITIYNTSDWSNVANPAVLPVNAANGVAFG